MITFNVEVQRSRRLSFAELRVWCTRVQSGVGGGGRPEHERAVSRHLHPAVAGGGARRSVDDDRPLVLGPDDVRNARIGVGRTVEAAGKRAGEVDVSGLRENVRQICRERRRDKRQQHTSTCQRHHHHHHHLTTTVIQNVTTAPFDFFSHAEMIDRRNMPFAS